MFGTNRQVRVGRAVFGARDSIAYSRGSSWQRCYSKPYGRAPARITVWANEGRPLRIFTVKKSSRKTDTLAIARPSTPVGYRMLPRSSIFLLTFASLMLAQQIGSVGDWPDWRGPD